MEMNLSFEADNRHFVYRAAGIILVENQLLMIKHKDYPCYYTVGGKVKFNESSEEAIIREMKEETGLDYEIERLAFVQERFFNLDDREQHEIIFYYYIKENINTKKLDHQYTDQGENEMMYLLDIDNIKDLNIIPEFFKNVHFDNINGIKHIISQENYWYEK